MRILVALCAFVSAVVLAQSDYSDVPMEVRQAIVARCQATMGDYGEDMVLYCAEQDIAAWRALQQYPATAKSAIDRCLRQMQNYGWDMVKYCADQDLQASQGLSDILN